jgi:hypothetical protein
MAKYNPRDQVEQDKTISVRLSVWPDVMGGGEEQGRGAGGQQHDHTRPQY